MKGKTVFITGAATGVGYGIAHAFLEARKKVAVSDIRATLVPVPYADVARCEYRPK